MLEWIHHQIGEWYSYWKYKTNFYEVEKTYVRVLPADNACFHMSYDKINECADEKTSFYFVSVCFNRITINFGEKLQLPIIYHACKSGLYLAKQIVQLKTRICFTGGEKYKQNHPRNKNPKKSFQIIILTRQTNINFLARHKK